jgi:hypothetical protein
MYYTMLYRFCLLTECLQTRIQFVIEQSCSCKKRANTALTSGVGAAIVGNNQVQIAKVIGLYAIATHDVCVEGHDDRPGRAARRLWPA